MRRLVGIVLAALAAAGCGEEGPTAVGGELIPSDAIRTFEVVLEPERFLVLDSAFAGYVQPPGVPFVIVAEDFEGALDAHGLVPLPVPRTVAVRDTLGVTRSDSLAQFFAGRLVVGIDTLASVGDLPVELRLYALAESFDPASASWTLRVDSGAVELPWSQPGGTKAGLVSSVEWDGQADSVVFAVDSATLALWRDTTNARAALVDVGTPGARLRLTGFALSADARPTIRDDTVVTVLVTSNDYTFVFDPPVATVWPAPRVGGVPAWRSFLRMRPRLDTLSVPCPGGPAGCLLRIGDTDVTLASLLLDPVGAPAGFSPEDSVRFGVRTLVVTEQVPLIRSPLGAGVGLMPRSLAPSRFVAGQPAVEVPITQYLRAAAADTTSEQLSPWVALLPVTEGGQFGFVQFAAGPRLRLVLTYSSGLDLQ